MRVGHGGTSEGVWPTATFGGTGRRLCCLVGALDVFTGVEVREAAAELGPATGAAVAVFPTGTVVKVFLLAGGVPADAWPGGGAGHPP